MKPWHIALAAFVAVLVVDALVFAPGRRRRKRAELQEMLDKLDKEIAEADRKAWGYPSGSESSEMYFQIRDQAKARREELLKRMP